MTQTSTAELRAADVTADPAVAGAVCPWRTFPGATCSCGDHGHSLTFGDALHTDWPDGGYPLPDGRLVVEARSDGTLWGRGRVHLCLSDDTCLSGMPYTAIEEADS